jgi:hypothetical protein
MDLWLLAIAGPFDEVFKEAMVTSRRRIFPAPREVVEKLTVRLSAEYVTVRVGCALYTWEDVISD